MKKETKQEIRKQMIQYTSVKGISDVKFSKSAGVSNAYISKVRNQKWESISDDKMVLIAHACGYQFSDWQTADTSQLRAINTICSTAQLHSFSNAISYAAGSGKSHGFKHYKSLHKNTYLLECAHHWTQRIFLQKLLQAIGVDSDGMRVYEMAERAIMELRVLDNPLVILDEADKLKEGPFLFFIELYNKLDGSCAFVLAGAPFLKKYIERSARRDKKGFREILSRIGRKFIPIAPITFQDVALICQANGVHDTQEINSIFNESQNFEKTEVDLRRVKRQIEILKIKAKTAA